MESTGNMTACSLIPASAPANMLTARGFPSPNPSYSISGMSIFQRCFLKLDKSRQVQWWWSDGFFRRATKKKVSDAGFQDSWSASTNGFTPAWLHATSLFLPRPALLPYSTTKIASPRPLDRAISTCKRFARDPSHRKPIRR